MVWVDSVIIVKYLEKVALKVSHRPAITDVNTIVKADALLCGRIKAKAAVPGQQWGSVVDAGRSGRNNCANKKT